MEEGEVKIEPQTKTANIPMTRRSFLKLAASLPLAAIPRETQQSKNDYLSVETPEAKYFPIYESHPQPVLAEQLRLLPPQDIFLYEYMADSRHFIDSSPQLVLDSKPGTIKQLEGFMRTRREYIVPRDHLGWLRENNVKVCFEGYTLPDSATLNRIFFKTGSLFVAGGTLRLLFSGEKNVNNRISRRQFLKLAASLATTWGLSPTVLGAIIPATETNIKPNALERILIKTNGLLSQTHPEDQITFFRNIVLARKLQFLGEVISKEKGRKANIIYNVGKIHAGIEDFLHIGKEWTLAFLNMVSKENLRTIVETNGGLENFCSNVLFDPNAQNPTKILLIDQELKNFLIKKMETQIEK